MATSKGTALATTSDAATEDESGAKDVPSDLASAIKLLAAEIGENIANENAAKGKKKTVVADVVRHDGPGIMVPKTMTLPVVVDILNRKIREEEETQEVNAIIPAFPWDGAYAFQKAMERVFGFVVKDNRKTMFGNTNSDHEVVIDAKGTTVTVPWGRFKVPGIEGVFQTSYAWEGKRVVFKVNAELKGKYVAGFKAVVELTKRIVAEESIYRHKVLRIKFSDDDGDRIPVPEVAFVDVSNAMRPILPADLDDTLQYDVEAYITNAGLMSELNGGTLKRGALFEGPYGTGKTLTAAWLARQAELNNWTFIYIDRPQDYPDAHLFARAYQPAVIFVEDVEHIAGVERTDDVNKLLNIIDGPDTKHLSIYSIFTSNHIGRVSPAMKRPGRIDVTMGFTHPDGPAAVQLIFHYAEGLIEEGEDLSAAGEAMAQAKMIPATIKEAVNRARARAVARQQDRNAKIICSDLLGAARAIEAERTRGEEVNPSEIQKLGSEIGTLVLHKAGAVIAQGSPRVNAGSDAVPTAASR